MSAKYKSPSFLLPNEINTNTNPLNTDGDSATGTGVNSLYSMDFDGTEYIDTGFVPADRLTLDFSISAWINMQAMNDNVTGSILGTYEFTNNRSRFFFRVINESGVYKYFFGLGPNSNYIQDTSIAISNFSVNTWVHIAVTYDGTNVKLYSNNTLDGTLSFSGTNNTYPPVGTGFNGNSYIGATNRTGGSGIESQFVGKIDELSIFNKALTDGTGGTVNQISSLYNSGSPASAATTINLGAIAYYPLGEQAQNTGYLTQEITNGWQFPNGVLQDYVMDFDGTSPGDAITSNTSGITGNAARTVSFWYNIGSSSSAMIPFSLGGINDTNSNSQFAYCVNRSNISTTAAIFGRGGNDIDITVPATNDSQWHNVIITYTGSTLALYIDGSNITLLSQPSAYATTDGFKIGGWSEAGNRLFDGKMSNVAIWNTAITDSAQIANIYNNGSPQTTYTVTPQNWWKLNADSVYTPSAPNYTTALDFTRSTDDHVEIPNSSSLNIEDSYTISLWANRNDLSQWSYLFDKGNTAGTILNWRILFNNSSYVNQVQFQINGTSGAAANIYSGTTPAVGAWTHIVCIKDSSTMRMYINGENTGNTATAPTGITNTDPAFIGTNHSGVYAAESKISNVAVFNSALSASQVSTLFNFGTPETNISFSPISWWKLDNLTTGIQDSGSASNNGTNNGTTQVNTSVAVVPSWKIPSALPITTTPSYTQALNFNNGTDVASDWVFYNQIPGTTDPFTFSIWFKQNETNSQESKFLSFRNNFVPTLDVTNNVLRFGIYDGGFRTVSYNIQNEKWNLITCGVDPSTNTVFAYLNGGNKKTTSYSGTRIDNTGTDGIYLGRCRDATKNVSWKGELSNFAWFNYVLPETGTESVQSIYNLGTPKDITGWSNNYLWYKLNSTTITDSSGNNRTGTNNNATLVNSDVLATQPVNGVSTTLPSTALQQSDLQFDSPFSNYSLNFDGTPLINTGTAIGNSLGVYNGSLSVSFWFKHNTAAQASMPLLFDMKPGAHNTAYGVFSVVAHSTSPTQIFATINSRARTLNANVPTAATQWNHLVFQLIYDSAAGNFDIKLYINGADSGVTPSGTKPTTGQIDFSNGDTVIGGISTGQNYNGKIDEASMFNYALSSAQVLEIYNNGKPGDLSNYSGTAPINWWRLGENAYFDNNNVTLPNSIAGGPNGVSSGTATSMLSADAPGTYANGIGTNLDIIDRVGDAPLSASNSQSYNMIPSDISPYVPQYVGDQIANNFSMTFDGVNDYFNVGIPNFLSAKSTFTISLWFNTDDINSQTTLCMVGSSASQLWGLSKFEDDLIIYGGSSTKYYRKNTLFNINTWYNLIVVYDGSQSNANRYKAYIDGSLLTNPTVYGTIDTITPTFTTDFNIGRIDYAAASYFNGKIDEVAIFDTALNAGQIYNDIYQPTATGTNQTADLDTNPNLPTPVAWYRMGD